MRILLTALSAFVLPRGARPLGAGRVRVLRTRNVDSLQSLAARTGHPIEVIVIPGVAHGMMSPAGFLSCGLHPAFLEAVGPWARARAP